MAHKEQARRAGQEAVSAWRTRLSDRAAEVVRSRPELAAGATDIGLVDKAWLDDPVNHPMRSAPPVDVVQRFLERSIEKEPSIIAAMGLNAIQILTSDDEVDEDGDTTHELTVMFTDLEGFTAFTSAKGDDAARTLLDRHHKALGPVIRSRGGRIVKRIGDGMLISFGAPEAAVLAALEIQDADPSELRLRVGIHHGDVVMLRDDLLGQNVNLAARVTDSAEGGQILATTSVVDLVGTLPGVDFGRPKRKSFKGVGEPVSVCRVERARGSA